MRLLAPACALLLVAACGSDDGASRVSNAAIEAWGLGSDGRRAVAVEDVAPMCNTVIVFAIDRITRAELPFVASDAAGAVQDRPVAPGVTPHLDSVAAGGDVARDAITTSTGGNGALATLLTGTVPAEHGIGTLRDLGRATLAPEATTLAEALQTAEWNTIASLSSPRHARGFSGFAQGFEDYAAPRVGERARDAASVVNGARMQLAEAFRTKQKVFALYAFESPGNAAVAGALDPERLAPFVATRLEPFRKRSAEVDAALERMAADPSAALEDLDALLGRARGSELSIALAMARREASLAAIDDAIGSVLAELESSGRAEHAMIAIVGLRGDLLPGERPETGPRLVPPVIGVPLALRYPCGAAAELPDGPLSLVDVPRRIASTFGVELESEPVVTDEAGFVYVSDPRFSVVALVGRDLHLEQYVDGEAVTFDRSGRQMRSDGVDLAGFGPHPAWRHGVRTELDVTTVDWAPEIGLSWHVDEGRMLPLTDDGKRLFGAPRPPSARGAVEIPRSMHALTLPLTRRGSAVRLGVSLPPSAAPDALDVLPSIGIGDALASELPLFLCPREDAPTAIDGQVTPVTLTRTNGLWWTLAVAGEGEAELLVTVWPPRAPTEELEVSAGGAVVAHAVPGRRDVVRLVGTAPFDLRVKKVGNEDFALTCRIGGRFVMPHEIAFNGLLYGTPRSAEFLLFDWQPSCSDGLASVDAALYRRPDSMDVPPAGALFSIRRSAPGGAPGPNAALGDDGLDFVRMLPPGE